MNHALPKLYPCKPTMVFPGCFACLTQACRVWLSFIFQVEPNRSLDVKPNRNCFFRCFLHVNPNKNCVFVSLCILFVKFFDSKKNLRALHIVSAPSFPIFFLFHCLPQKFIRVPTGAISKGGGLSKFDYWEFDLQVSN